MIARGLMAEHQRWYSGQGEWGIEISWRSFGLGIELGGCCEIPICLVSVRAYLVVRDRNYAFALHHSVHVLANIHIHLSCK